MAGQENKSLNVKTNGISTQKCKPYELIILHHNVQSLNKLLDLSISLSTDEVNADVLCFTEHWLKANQLNSIYIDQFKQVSSFCRSTSTGGGSSIYVKNFLRTKDLVYFNRLLCEKTCELSAIELTDFNLILICIYTSPMGILINFCQY